MDFSPNYPFDRIYILRLNLLICSFHAEMNGEMKIFKNDYFKQCLIQESEDNNSDAMGKISFFLSICGGFWRLLGVSVLRIIEFIYNRLLFDYFGRFIHGRPAAVTRFETIWEISIAFKSIEPTDSEYTVKPLNSGAVPFS